MAISVVCCCYSYPLSRAPVTASCSGSLEPARIGVGFSVHGGLECLLDSS